MQDFLCFFIGHFDKYFIIMIIAIGFLLLIDSRMLSNRKLKRDACIAKTAGLFYIYFSIFIFIIRLFS